MEDLLDKNQTQPAKPTECQIGAWEEVAEEENFFLVNKAIEKGLEDDGESLGKRSRLLFETE